jgi:predicted GTPase
MRNVKMYPPKPRRRRICYSQVFVVLLRFTVSPTLRYALSLDFSFQPDPVSLLKGKVCLMVYCSPEALKKAIDEAITTYAAAPHTALSNVSPRDVYAGRKEEILQKRAEKKRLTLTAEAV